MVGNNTAQAVVYDIEMCKVVMKLDCAKSYSHTPNTQANEVRYHASVTGDDLYSLKCCVNVLRVAYEGEAEEEL